MACNLAVKGKETVFVYDIDPTRAAQVAKESGAVAVETKEAVFSAADILFLCLPSNALVQQTLEEIYDTVESGVLVVDLSSTDPSVIRTAHEKCKQRRIGLVDAPVSGGSWGAQDGTLTIMCGGDKADFLKAEPYLDRLGTVISYMGSTGSGDVTKIVNNMIVGANILAVAEGFALAKKAGLDVDTVFHAIRAGFAGSEVMEKKAQKMLSHDFEALARIAVHHKDIDNATRLAKDLAVSIPLTDLVADAMRYLASIGKSDEDQAALVRYYEDSMDVDVSN